MADWRHSTACHDGVTQTPIVYAHDAGVVASAFISPVTGLWTLVEGGKTLSRHTDFDDLNDAADLHFEALHRRHE